MKNKSETIIKTLIEKLKQDECLCALQRHGTYGSRAEITMYSEGKAEDYSVIVVKHTK